MTWYPPFRDPIGDLDAIPWSVLSEFLVVLEARNLLVPTKYRGYAR